MKQVFTEARSHAHMVAKVGFGVRFTQPTLASNPCARAKSPPLRRCVQAQADDGSGVKSSAHSGDYVQKTTVFEVMRRLLQPKNIMVSTSTKRG